MLGLFAAVSAFVSPAAAEQAMARTAASEMTNRMGRAKDDLTAKQSRLV